MTPQPVRESAPPAAAATDAALAAEALRKDFTREDGTRVAALAGVSLLARHRELTALVGPDGAGKTTLLRLAAGLLVPDAGSLRVLGIDVAAEPQRVQDRISYMPQRFGLYEDLTVQENLDLYADLHGVDASQRAQRYPELMQMTALGPFRARLAGRLSGGMKQKLGLACTLVRAPELLLLDEPTVGVDPLSRRELWEIVLHLVRDQGLTVLMSTAYLDEAERCQRVVLLHRGSVLAQDAPAAIAQHAAGCSFSVDPLRAQGGGSARALQARLLDRPDTADAVPDGGSVRWVRHAAGVPEPDSGATPVAPRFEDGFMLLLRGGSGDAAEPTHGLTVRAASHAGDGAPAVRVTQLLKRFGAFVAVDRIDFEVARGEIFGLLGPNGAGKTTTFRMLCGLLRPSSGELSVAGADVRRAAAAARGRLGYVAQRFSLYGPLTVLENLEFFASAYGLRGAARRQRIRWALEQFDLGSHAAATSARLPGGFKQRLAMAAALLHEPEILFLDEPTSGADPLARRAFWRRITALAEQGVTVIVTTHFMQEAEYCDRIAIMDSGRVLACGTPGEIRAHAARLPASRAAPESQPQPREQRMASMEDAFIAVVEQARERGAAEQRRALA